MAQRMFPSRQAKSDDPKALRSDVAGFEVVETPIHRPPEFTLGCASTPGAGRPQFDAVGEEDPGVVVEDCDDMSGLWTEESFHGVGELHQEVFVRLTG